MNHDLTDSGIPQESPLDAVGVSPIPGFFSASADIFSTIEWAGISDVRDGEGNPVASFTAMSGDGIDYATGVEAAVPAVAPIALLSVAALAFGVRRLKAA